MDLVLGFPTAQAGYARDAVNAAAVCVRHLHQFGLRLVGNETLPAGLSKAEVRRSRVQAPGSTQWIEFVEYKGVDRTPLRMKIQDRGAARLQTRVQNIDYLQFTAKSDGNDYPEYSDDLLADMIAADVPAKAWRSSVLGFWRTFEANFVDKSTQGRHHPYRFR